MKKVFMGMFAIATMLLATSCSEDELIAQSSGNEVTVSFTANVRSDVKTKAVGDDTEGIDQLIFAVYDENGKELPALRQSTHPTEDGCTNTTAISLSNVNEKGQRTATINVTLVKGQTYSFAFWAQNKAYTAYSFDPDAKLVSVNYGQTANNKNADAFFANETLTVSGSFEKDITLKRPFAQVNFLTTQTDIDKAKDAGFVPSQSSIVVKNAATSLNVLDGTVTGSTEATFNLANLIENTETTTIKNAQGSGIKFENTTDVTNFRYLATAYFLTTEGAAVTTIDASMNVVAADNGKMDLSVSGVNAQRNYRTNIYGNLLTSGGKFNVTVDPGFDGDHNDEYEDPTTKVVGTIAEAQALFDNTSNPVTNVTITEAPTSDATLTLPDTQDDVTINFAFDENANPETITINGGSTSNNVTVNGDAGDLVINAPNSTVTLNGNYTSVTATTAQNTLIVPKGVTIETLKLMAGNAEIYYGAVTTLQKDANYDGTITWLVDAGDVFEDALVNGDGVKLMNDIEVPENVTMTIANGSTKSIDLNGAILSSTNNKTGNAELFLVKGILNVNNGTIKYEYTGEDQAWNAMGTIFDITAGGVLNMNSVVANNLGGTAMNFVAHLNNWGNATLKADNCEFNATYCGVRVFNSGPQMNNVEIKNSKLTGKSMAFWVHNYIYEGKNSETLDLDIYNNNNSFEITGTAITPIRYGFDAYYYYNEKGELVSVDVFNQKGLQGALDVVTNNVSINLKDNISADVTVTQKESVNITIDGNNYNYNGVILIDGKSARYTTAGLTIQNVNFSAESISADAYINLGKEGDNNTRYTNNVTVKDCSFFTSATTDVVAVKSYTGGDHNLSVIGCTVNEGMHSMLQVTNVEVGLKIADCKVYSKNGINLNNTPSFNMSGCTFDTKGYAIRVGVNGSVNSEKKAFTVSNSTLKSACEDGDAVIIFRENATFAELTLTNTTLEGSTKISGNTNQTKIIGTY